MLITTRRYTSSKNQEVADLKSKGLQGKDFWIVIALMVIVPIAGELNFHPFDNIFRVSFGTPIFFFSLLYFRNYHSVLIGLLIGISVFVFRVGLDWLVLTDFNFDSSFSVRFPTFLYYFSFSVLFYLLKVNRFQHPLLIGIFGITIEITSSLIELILQLYGMGSSLTVEELNKIIIIAVFRSFFVLAFINMMKLYELKLKESQTRKENENMLMHLSNLYVESVYLKKTLQNAETITKESYNLYRDMSKYKQDLGVPIEKWGSKSLRIAGEVHEIKKDNQRIFAGLSKLITSESLPEYMSVNDLVTMIIRINQKYAGMLGKKIEFVSHIKGEHPHYHIYLMLSFINNLVANAVEAIEHKGRILLSIERVEDWIECKVIDNGPGVPSKNMKLIFKPGFTSKYSDDGTPSTGIGLSYIKEMAEELGGEVILNQKESECIFTIRLPIGALVLERVNL